MDGKKGSRKQQIIAMVLKRSIDKLNNSEKVRKYEIDKGIEGNGVYALNISDIDAIIFFTMNDKNIVLSDPVEDPDVLVSMDSGTFLNLSVGHDIHGNPVTPMIAWAHGQIRILGKGSRNVALDAQVYEELYRKLMGKPSH